MRRKTMLSSSNEDQRAYHKKEEWKKDTLEKVERGEPPINMDLV